MYSRNSQNVIAYSSPVHIKNCPYRPYDGTNLNTGKITKIEQISNIFGLHV